MGSTDRDVQARRALLVGVTGLPGSGKTALATRWAVQGACLISGDSLGHEVGARETVRERLVRTFGHGILHRDGTIDRRALGGCLAGPAEVEALNRIVHPPLLELMAVRIREALGESSPLVVVDAALIPEWGIEAYFDLVVFVRASAPVRMRRLKNQGRDPRLMTLLERTQLDEGQKRRKSHLVVENEWTIEDLNRRADALLLAFGGGTLEEPCRKRLWKE